MTELDSTKYCSDCDETKSTSEFYKDKRRRDGLGPYCKPCWKVRAQKTYQKHREKRLAKQRAYYEENYEKERASRKRYYEANREKAYEDSRAWQAKNLEKNRAYKAKYRETNREKINEAERKRYEENRDKEIERRRKYYEDNPDKRRERNRKARQARLDNLEERLERERQAREDNRDARNRSNREWKKRNPHKVAEDRHRRREAVKVAEDCTEYIAVLQRDPCSYCGGPGGSIDHITPVTKGGLHELDNLAAACMSCNPSKGNKSLLIFLLHRKE